MEHTCKIKFETFVRRVTDSRFFALKPPNAGGKKKLKIFFPSRIMLGEGEREAWRRGYLLPVASFTKLTVPTCIAKHCRSPTTCIVACG